MYIYIYTHIYLHIHTYNYSFLSLSHLSRTHTRNTCECVYVCTCVCTLLRSLGPTNPFVLTLTHFRLLSLSPSRAYTLCRSLARALAGWLAGWRTGARSFLSLSLFLFFLSIFFLSSVRWGAGKIEHTRQQRANSLVAISCATQCNTRCTTFVQHTVKQPAAHELVGGYKTYKHSCKYTRMCVCCMYVCACACACVH